MQNGVDINFHARVLPFFWRKKKNEKSDNLLECWELIIAIGKGESNLSKIEDIRRRRKIAHSKLLALGSKVYEKFIQLEETTYADGALKKKDKELIAIGIAVVTNCESCMEWHISEAVKSGATFREILEAIEVGIEFGGGRATVSARFALEVMDDFSKKAKS